MSEAKLKLIMEKCVQYDGLKLLREWNRSIFSNMDGFKKYSVKWKDKENVG